MSTTITPPDTPAERRQEVQQRFRWIQRLIDDATFRYRLFGIFTLIALPIIISLTAIANVTPVLSYDVNTTLALQGIPFALLQQLMRLISFFGYMPWAAVVVVIGAVGVGLWLGWRNGLYFFMITLLQGGLNSLIKTLIARPRPIDSLVQVFVEASGSSFPSGHVMFYTVFFGFLGFLVMARLPASWGKRGLLVLLWGLVAFIGPSRIYLGAHWFSDVLAAYLIGFIILSLAIEIYLRYLAPHYPTAADQPTT